VPAGDPQIVALDPERLGRLRLAPRVIPPADPTDGHALLAAALASPRPVTAIAAVVGDVVAGLAMIGAARPLESAPVLALGVAPELRGRGLGGSLLNAAVEAHAGPIEAIVGVAERDPIDPASYSTRIAIGRRLLEGAGFAVTEADGPRGQIDRGALIGVRP
jgi:GNAT superfamily N-acetyltransferase